MYPYHNRIKQRIDNNELLNMEFVDNYPNIGKCLVLTFGTKPYKRPIRPHAYDRYEFLFS